MNIILFISMDTVFLQIEQLKKTTEFVHECYFIVTAAQLQFSTN